MVTCTTPPFRAAVRLNSGVRRQTDNMVPEILLSIGVLAILASWGVRFRLFATASSDKTFADLSEDTFATTFTDLLFIQLYRHRSEIDPQFRTMVVTYFWLHVVAFVFIVAGSLTTSFAERGLI